VLVPILVVAKYFFKQIQEKITTKLTEQRKIYQWNRPIKMFDVAFVAQSIKVVLVIRAGSFLGPVAIAAVLIFVPFAMGAFLVMNHSNLDSKSFRGKYQEMYKDISLTNKKKWAILFFPFCLIYKLLLILSPLVA